MEERKKYARLFLYHPERPEEILDVFIDEPIPFLTAYERKINKRSGNVSIPIISIPDLIKMKKKSGRAQDIEDIKALQRLQKV